MLNGSIDDLEALRSIGGEPAPSAAKKVRTELDEHASRFAALARLAVFAIERPDERIDIGARLGGPSLAVVFAGAEVWLADHPASRLGATTGPLRRSSRAGLLLLVPGVADALRVRGRAQTVQEPEVLRAVFGAQPPGNALRVDVEEACFHRAEALLRSRLWTGDVELPDAEGDFSFSLRSDRLEAPHRAWLARSTLVLLATRDAGERCDVSAHGGPPGFGRALDERTLLVPDDRRLDAFPDAIDRPDVALLSLVPGERAALRLRGRAQRPSGSAPGLRIEIREAVLERRPAAFQAIGLWRRTACSRAQTSSGNGPS